MRTFERAGVLLVVLFVWTARLCAQVEEPISFSADVRTILSNRCFKCHGFDPETREADVRLDTFEGLFSEVNGTHAFVPGNLDQSEAFARITADDPDVRMPPASAKMELTPSEIETIKKWIEQGAKWEPHWAFIPPKRPTLHSELQGNAAEPVGALDKFVLEKLQAVNLKPSPEANRNQLIRRVTLDLTGLPPTQEEIQDFLNDTRPDAYDQLVNRLISSSAYGELWARRWLDLARYSDTNGYEKDRTRSIWPYRDWVVNAFNQNMPFDEFTIKQLAGDLIPNASESDRVATGFHRNTMLNEEGGIDPLEFRFHAMTDRVATTGTTWLGLTTGCAQCHDHKYDPISHIEYFGLMAFLNNADEIELALHENGAQPPVQKDLNRIEELKRKLPEHWPISDEEKASSTAIQKAETAFQQWLSHEQARATDWHVIQPKKLSANLPLLTLENDGIVFVTGDITKRDQYQFSAELNAKNVTAIRLEVLPDERLPGSGPGMTYYEGNKGDFFLTEFLLTNNGSNVAFGASSESYWKNQFGANRADSAAAIDGDQQTGWSIDGRQGSRLVAVFNLAEPTELNDVMIELNFGRHFAASLGKFRLSYTTTPDPVALDLSLEEEKLLAKSELDDVETETLRLAFFLQSSELKSHADELRKALAPAEPLTTLVFRERPVENPRPTFLHHRGEFMQAKQEVLPVTIAALNSYPEDEAKNRLGFAKWLVSRENPLTARVVVNRQWAAFFGRGIVATLDDFGFQGSAPTHPELLDWLAVEFMDSGWDLKHIHRLIVTSQTYKQDSKLTSESLAIDPANFLLSRAPRLRLEAEVIRDSALVASNLLCRKLGGPPVYPPQPEGVTETAYGSPAWPASRGEDRYRRSLYTFSKRTAPFAMFTTFDAPSGEACIARRDVSNTALQGLTMLNDEMFLEIAQSLGHRVIDANSDSKKRVNELFIRVLSREPTADEVVEVLDFVAIQEERFKQDLENARKLVGRECENISQQAAWVAVSRAVLSLDEAITRN